MVPDAAFLTNADETYQLERPLKVDARLTYVLDELVATGQIKSYEFNDSKTVVMLNTDDVVPMKTLRTLFGEVDIIK